MQEKRKWYRRILGYRSGSKWKAILASFFYFFLFFSIVSAIFVDDPAPTLEENASEEAIEAEKVEAEEERKVQEAKEQEKAEEQAAKDKEKDEKQKAQEEEKKAKEEREQEEQKAKEQEAAEKQADKEKEETERQEAKENNKENEKSDDKSSSGMINDYVLDHSYGIMLDYEGVKEVHATADEDSKTISLAIIVESAMNVDYSKNLADSFIRSLSSGASIYGDEDLDSPNEDNFGELYDYYDLHVVVATSSEEYIIQGFKAKGSQSLVY